MKTTTEILDSAVALRTFAATLSEERKNAALLAMADALEASTDEILEANAGDVSRAKGRVSDVMIDRLTLTPARISGMAKGIRDVALLPDPVGRTIEKNECKNGLSIERISVPFGVIAVIYESRPNVTSDVAALCLKSGNVPVLRGGKEAFGTSFAIVSAMRKGLRSLGLPEELVSTVEDTDRKSAEELMKAVGKVDLLIPRGGAGLIRACVENALVPCIETGTGICHLYVDESADFGKALAIIENAKASRPSVCNAAEVLLVNRKIAGAFLPLLAERLGKDREAQGLVPVTLVPDAEAAAILSLTPGDGSMFDTEYLDYKLSVGIVPDCDAAIAHIAKHSTHHSESIITEDQGNAEKFLRSVDSAAVYHNASTRFTDGGEFGLGCEIGISTQKLHARGPMGLRELTTYKYVIRGNGQVR